MKIKISYTYYRHKYNQSTILSSVILDCPVSSKESVTKTVKDWIKAEWVGKGSVTIKEITTTYKADYEACKIPETIFYFNRKKL